MDIDQFRTTKNLTGVAYGNGTFIAIGQDGVTLRSPDGLTWTQGPTINYGMIDGYTFKYNKFIAVGNLSKKPHYGYFMIFIHMLAYRRRF